VQSNTLFIIKYLYIGYKFRLTGAIIRPLPEYRSKFCTIGIPEVYGTGVYCLRVQLS